MRERRDMYGWGRVEREAGFWERIREREGLSNALGVLVLGCNNLLAWIFWVWLDYYLESYQFGIRARFRP